MDWCEIVKLPAGNFGDVDEIAVGQLSAARFHSQQPGRSPWGPERAKISGQLSTFTTSGPPAPKLRLGLSFPNPELDSEWFSAEMS